MIKKLDENTSLKFTNLSQEYKKNKSVLGRLYGKVASCVNPTRNERKYSEELWSNLFESPLIKERFANGGVFGELCHPDYEEVNMEKIAIVMPEPPVKDKDGDLVAYVDILDTPCGRIAYQLAKYGYKFGISSRGTGDIIESVSGDEVDPDTYQLNAFDLVEIPAVESARLSFVESFDTTKKYGKTLKQKLTEEVNKASDDNKKLMIESLKNIGINLNESYSHEWLKYDGDVYTYEEAVDLVLDILDISREEFDEDPSYYFDQCDMWYTDAPKYYSDPSEYINGITVDDWNDEVRLGMIRESNELKYEALWYPDKDCSGDYSTAEFDTKEDLIKFYKEHKNDEDKFSWWLTSRDSDWNVVDDIPLEEECTSENCADKEEEIVDEVVTDKSDTIVEELQESLLKIKTLADDNLKLQEELSVCNAKELKLEEKLDKHREAIADLSVKAKEAKTLKEDLNKIKGELDDKVKLSESLKSDLDKLTSEKEEALKALAESDASTNKLNLLVENLQSQLDKSNETLKKYKKAYASLKESYISSKAEALNISVDSIKKNLNESYSIKNIDDVCDKLSEQRRSLSKLPFRVDESLSVNASSSRRSLVKHDDFESDDDISSLLKMTNL